jgi:putative peptidoglycan lipid II flippase
MSVSAAELPEMSSALGDEHQTAEYLRRRLAAGLRQIAYFVIPSAIAFVVLGDVIATALFQHGRFTRTDTTFTWGILAGSAVGLLASTLGRLYSSTYYALHDTRTPLRFALVRVALTTVLGYLFAIPLPNALGIDARWGAAGLTASAGIAGWVECHLLRSRLSRRIGAVNISAQSTLLLWSCAAAAAAVGFGLKLATAGLHRFAMAAIVLSGFGFGYFALTYLFHVPEARRLVERIHRR